jgi:uncharacterized protein
MAMPPFPPSAPAAPQRSGPVAAWWHTVALIVIILAFSAYQGQPRLLSRATRLPSRIPIYAASLAYELFLFCFVWLAGLKPRQVTLREIIGGRWNRLADFMIDLAVAFLFTVVVWITLLVSSLLLHFRGVQAAAPLLPKTWTEAAAFVVLAVTAGFCEEFVFRGYLQRQFLAWFGTAWVAVAVQAMVFGGAHMYQGWRGVVTITIYGALFGVLAALRKSLRPGMLQHAGQDTFSGLAVFILTKYKLMPPLNLF